MWKDKEDLDTSILADNPVSRLQNNNLIVTYLGENLNDYTKNFFHFLGEKSFYCPKCGSKLRFHDKYDRSLIFGSERFEFLIQRCFCSQCRTTHAILPDFVSPYKHYSAAEIEMVLEEHYDRTPVNRIDSPASVDTIKRWIKSYDQKICQAIPFLLNFISIALGIMFSFLDFTGSSPLENLEELFEKIEYVETSGLTIGKANITLTVATTELYL